MTFIVKAKVVGRGPNTQMPIPPKPAWVKVREAKSADFIPQHLTDEQKEDLRSAAKAVAAALSGAAVAAGHLIPFADQPNRYYAGRNMHHFLRGSGDDIVYDDDNIEDMFNNLLRGEPVKVDSVENSFFQSVFDDMSARGDGTVGYLSQNETSSSHPDYMSPWFGTRSDPSSTWHFAVGAFQFAYGAVGIRRGEMITIHHRVYIYDRYNWNLETTTTASGKVVQTSQGVEISDNIDWIIRPVSTVRAAENIDFVEGGQPYLEHNETGGTYILRDALFGSLQESDGASPFDMTGAGSIETRVIRLRDDGFISSAQSSQGQPLYTPPTDSGRGG